MTEALSTIENASKHVPWKKNRRSESAPPPQARLVHPDKAPDGRPTP